MITFRKITKKNYQEVLQLQLLPETGKILMESTCNVIARSVFENRIEFLKAIYNNNIMVGLICFYPTRKNKIFIDYFLISKDNQGKGLGKKSIQKAINYIKREYKPSTIELWVNNPIAIHLYKSFGFEIAKKEEIILEDMKYNNYKLVLHLK